MPNFAAVTALTAPSTDAAYRTFVNSIADGLAAAGFVLVADSGDIDPVTVTKPASSSYANYQIWRFNDSLQATKPIFFKVKYAQRSDATPQIGLSVGTGSDGAGTLTGAMNSLTGSGDNYPIGMADAWFSGNADESRFMWITAAYRGLLLMMERTRDADGTPNGDGVFCLCGAPGWSGLGLNGVYALGGVAWAKRFIASNDNQLGLPVPVVGDGWSLSDGTDKGMYGILPSGLHIYSPCLSAWAYSTADDSTDRTFDIDLYGETRTFKAKTGTTTIGTEANARNSNRFSLAMLWENA